MLYFFKANLLTMLLEFICSVSRLAVINPFKLSVKESMGLLTVYRLQI